MPDSEKRPLAEENVIRAFLLGVRFGYKRSEEGKNIEQTLYEATILAEEIFHHA